MTTSMQSVIETPSPHYFSISNKKTFLLDFLVPATELLEYFEELFGSVMLLLVLANLDPQPHVHT